MEELFIEDQTLYDFRTALEGTVLHFAVDHSDKCKDNDKSTFLRILLHRFEDLVDIPDINGNIYTVYYIFSCMHINSLSCDL